jgi:hypothetical protein
VQTGNEVLIGGFIITGTNAKTVIIRAIGPSLTLHGVSDALQDPLLELFDSNQNLIAQNDNWRDAQQTDIIATGIPPTDDRESAIVITLPPSNYTALVVGQNNTSGTGVVEVYDLDPMVGSILANISSRGFVGTGDNVLIAGFIILPNGTSANVVVRALGPSLSTSNVSGALQDPTLELRDANGTLLGANDNWRDSQATEIQADNLAPTDNRESAIAASLPAGSYTTIVRGRNQTTGVGLVEVYRLQ